MLNIEYLPPSAAWQPDVNTIHSFSGPYRVCRVLGPARLVRLITFGGHAPEGQMYGPNRANGSFWFAEADFLRMTLEAETSLRREGSNPGQLGMYLRHQFRFFLAVPRDATASFDAYVVLSIPPGASLVALVGQIKEQPVYTTGFPGADTARQAGISLAGGWTQYVISFCFGSNRDCPYHISPPLPL